MTTIAESKALALAKQFDIQGDPAELVSTLKATAFKGNATNEQFTALMIVAGQYGLNPFTREIYAFPDKSNGIVPVVGVDGWSRIINNHPQFDGIEYEQDAESCTCVIYRKDRKHPTRVIEYIDECRRNTGPWQSHPRRMLRHKATIQCARLAFGFTGIFDEDEGERVKNAADHIPEGQTNPFTGDLHNEERARLIAQGEAQAQHGMEALKAWFETIGKDARKIIGIDQLNRLKAMADQADIIDVEAIPPTAEDELFEDVPQ